MKDRLKKLVEENTDLDHLRVKNSKNKNYLKMEQDKRVRSLRKDIKNVEKRRGTK
tara:strand:+ start:134 stop:298 length:165 start_codon:yes stop_codon:yes gene_type:complete